MSDEIVGTDTAATPLYDEAFVMGLRGELKAAEDRNQELEITLMRDRAARVHKLPSDLVEFITGSNEEEANAQAAKLAAGIRPKLELPPSGNRNPANGGEQAARLDEETRFDALRNRVPALNGRVLRS